ncbi:MerR family transcriptional regulator [Nitrospirillum iridis]|uniref:DNA-binding transcriptional MerR regulator n=1 Tax=Nitrospirillum iridis TaxID=765888 RepID=A0A7X0AU16_9PROT|nr:MerR family transcriptional regulator [Nitrospirillum iridis]MBB6250099.1 DNA-binding transcriptional MerR regulator [Nitrospirillum iridis]
MDQRKPPAAGLGPGDVATKLGITPKALRVYERAGLLTPERRAGGWRRYSNEDVARLHQILALKGLGLSLRQIGDVLAGDGAGLAQTLSLQSHHLEKQIAALGQRLEAVTHARRRLAAGESLSLDELIGLARQAAAPQAPLTPEEVRHHLIERARERGLDQELAAMRNAVADRLRGRGRDIDDIRADVAHLLSEADRLARDGHAAGSPAAQSLAHRWQVLVSPLLPAAGEGEPVPFGAGLRQLAVDLHDGPILSPGFSLLIKALTPPGDHA